jgi:hypothetical protein
MADKWKSDDEVTGAPAEERLRGIADDEDFDDAEELDDEEREDDEESPTF